MYSHMGVNLNIKLLDSLNFLSMALLRLPESFGLKQMKKGYFPHLYSTEEILSYPPLERLPHLPDASFYNPDNMSCKKRDEFLLWYEKNKHFHFDYHRELLMYCQSNVDILLKACWKFRELFVHSTGPDNPVDPFNYITIVSICMGTFRAKCLPKEWEVLLKTNASPNCTPSFLDV